MYPRQPKSPVTFCINIEGKEYIYNDLEKFKNYEHYDPTLKLIKVVAHYVKKDEQDT